tara:strand:- start:224 stop:430 length:207 start_codon:yes stop_codon:yes gene_type:complete
MDLREKINHRIDTLQEILENNEHIDKPEAAEAVIHRISPFWSILSEEDREYVQAAQHAIEDKLKWGKP